VIEHFDIAIIGAGPAGLSAAAKTTAETSPQFSLRAPGLSKRLARPFSLKTPDLKQALATAMAI
jgi:predicted NAD/FAD-dependent oxidoreductase